MPIGIFMSGTQVSKSEFKAKALEFFRQVETSGQSLIVTDHGKPAVEVCPYRNVERNPLDVLRGSVVQFKNPMAPVVEDEWEGAQ
ncbi:MAG: prevent-host-death protein [Solimicrobium sp.]|jgi:prevent-host-death family protein|nr:prevent-host-death protein [Solimicrobium sp.]